MTFLHATDLRHVPLILTYGLFSGIGRAPLAIGDNRGEAYTRQIVTRQCRKGWEIVVLVFALPPGWVTEADEPAGVGFDLLPAEGPLTLPPTLLKELATILPQGPGIVRTFVEWDREGSLVRIPPHFLDRAATLKQNERLVKTELLPAATLAGLQAILGRDAQQRLMSRDAR